jgi:hypothetical protein
MREVSLVARRDGRGAEVLVVHRPIPFTLDQTARAMHAVIDAPPTARGARRRVGRSRVREVLKQVVTQGWPAGFVPNPARVEFWRRWLVEHAVFTDDANR